MKLVVVESPAKAKTIEKYLGRGYRVLEHLNTQSAITYLKKVVTEGSEA